MGAKLIKEQDSEMLVHVLKTNHFLGRFTPPPQIGLWLSHMPHHTILSL